MKTPTATAIAGMIHLSPDIDTLSIDDNTYTRCLQRPREELQRWLYSVIHAGNPRIFDITKLQDENLYSKITNSLSDPWFKIKTEEQSTGDGTKVAEVGGIRIQKTSADSPDTISVPCFRPNVTPGFFMFNHTEPVANGSSIVIMRYYVSAGSPEFAISVWSKAISYLLEAEKNFSAKVLSSSESYPRNDAVVFYLPSRNRPFEKQLCEIIRDEPDNDESCEGSPLCQTISPHVTMAQQPEKRGNEEVSFGEHRCGIIAKAVQDHFSTGADFLPLLIARLEQENVDPNNLSVNMI